MRMITMKISPLTAVAATAILVVGSSVVANHFLGKSTRTLEPRVTVESGRSAGEQALKESQTQRKVVVAAIDGEVSRTADRAGEAQAVAIAASLYAATEQIEGRIPPNADGLLAGMATQNLLPPGVTLIKAEGAMACDHGILYLRYRPSPLAIEVLAIGREKKDGPALLVRVPDDNTREGGASIFMATRISDVSIPTAFTPASEVISAGWSLVLLRPVK